MLTRLYDILSEAQGQLTLNSAQIRTHPSFYSCPRYLQYEGHLESSWHGIITIQCVNERVSNNSGLEPRIQPLHDGWFTSEKVLGMHVQRMLETSRCLYTGVNFK